MAVWLSGIPPRPHLPEPVPQEGVDVQQVLVVSVHDGQQVVHGTTQRGVRANVGRPLLAVVVVPDRLFHAH
eukprot:355082-Chlamydomonas_euryale.AAC.3